MIPAKYAAALIRAMAHRCGLEDPDVFEAEGGVLPIFWQPQPGTDPHRGRGRTTRMVLAALVALEVGCSVTIEALDAGWAGYISAKITTLASEARLPAGIWSRFSLTWLAQVDKPVNSAEVYLVDHRVMSGEAD